MPNREPERRRISAMEALQCLNKLPEKSGTLSAKRESGKPTPYLRLVIGWVLSVLGPHLVAGFLITTCAFAQTAGVSSMVTDSSGARVPKANVTVLNKDTGIGRATDSNNDGYYTVPLLQPGNYMITVKAAGCATQVRTSITLEVGAQQVLNLTMKVGQVSEKVEVTGEASTVQLATSDISGVVSQTAVVELPLNARDWSQLATLQPGVESVGSIQANTGNIDRAKRGYGVQMAISGSRPTQNNYRIDGISVNDYTNGGPGSVEGSTLGVDAVQEFSVLTSNYSAEYGRTSGGVINALTKSGTNEFHGDVFEFIRNSALDARNFFDNVPGTKIPPFRRNQ